MIKKVDSTPTRMMDKSELIVKVYNLSDEIENLNNRIEQYKSKIELLKKRQRPTIKIVEKIVHVYDMNHVDKNDNDLDNAIDFAVELTGVERKYIMEKRRTGQQVVGFDFISQGSDKPVDTACADIAVITPDSIENIITSKSTSRPFKKIFQKFEFLR